MIRKLFRFLFVRADKQFPDAWWCPSCQEAHYARMQGWKKR